ncbi:MAG: glycosyltransferase 87 family protein [Pseudomonadota bacterium]
MSPFKSPVFLAGLTLRLAMIVVFAPVIHAEWFAPFLQHAVSNPSMVPWASFLATGGAAEAFPYGWLYVLAYGPGALIGNTIGGVAGIAVAISLTTLAIDVVLYGALARLAKREERTVTLACYWLSPITLYVGYFHGQLDVFPVLLLTAAFLFLRIHRARWAAYLMGLAVAAKASMVFALPFVVIYLLGQPRLRARIPGFLLASVFASAALILPFATFPAFREMVLGTPEAAKATELSIVYGQALQLYIFPMAYAGLLFVAWRVRRMHFDALVAFVAASFLLLYCLTPASPGWALWFMPFLALHVARTPGPQGKVLFGALSTVFVALHLMVSPSATLRFAPEMGPLALPNPGISSWVLSALVLIGVVMLAQLLRERIFASPYHRATRKPIVVNIAGDSGTGKDTLSDLIVDMIGGNATTEVSGDDYHIWDRHKPMWQALTHLNPKANHLDRLTDDVRALATGKPVRARHYDHSVGRMTKPLHIPAADTLVVSGLHALYPRALYDLSDLRIFLDMDEDLRRYLKVRRDVTQRGHPIEKVISSLDRREPDRQRFILPQKDQASLVLSLEPARARDIADPMNGPAELDLRVRVTSRRSEDFARLSEILVSVCGAYLVERRSKDGGVEILIEGYPSQRDVKNAARAIAGDFEDFMSLDPVWHGGANGFLQLVVLEQMSRLVTIRGGQA